MTTVRTDLRNTRESARLIRFETVGVITETNVQKAIERVLTAPKAIVPTPVDVADSPYSVQLSDTYLSVDTSGGPVSIVLPTAASRGGFPLTIKDGSGDAATNNITITPNGSETIDGLSSLTISIPYGFQNLTPNSGVGWQMLGSV